METEETQTEETEKPSENRRASTLSEDYLKDPNERLELTDEEREEAREARKAEREASGNRRASSLSEEYERSLDAERESSSPPEEQEEN